VARSLTRDKKIAGSIQKRHWNILKIELVFFLSLWSLANDIYPSRTTAKNKRSFVRTLKKNLGISKSKRTGLTVAAQAKLIEYKFKIYPSGSFPVL
jgi:hypothetical protein